MNHWQKILLSEIYYYWYIVTNPDYEKIEAILSLKGDSEGDVHDQNMFTSFTFEALVAQDAQEIVRSQLTEMKKEFDLNLVKIASSAYVLCCYIHNKPLTDEDQEWVDLASQTSSLKKVNPENPASLEIMRLMVEKERLSNYPYITEVYPDWVETRLKEINAQLNLVS